MAQEPQGQRKPRFPYKSDPSVRDTFCDSARLAFFDGSVLRLEFTVDRFDEKKWTDKQQPKGNAVTAARIALPASAVPELYNQLTQIMSVMKQQGMLRPGPKPANQTDEIVQ